MAEMQFADDLREFLKSLACADAEFIVVGGYAVGFHGFPRNTGDLDIWVNPTAENSLRVAAALESFGFPVDDACRRALVSQNAIIRMGYPPARIELLTGPTGIAFSACMRNAVIATIGGCAVRVLGLDDLIANKRAAGRPRDLIDVAELERLRSVRRPSDGGGKSAAGS